MVAACSSSDSASDNGPPVVDGSTGTKKDSSTGTKGDSGSTGDDDKDATTKDATTNDADSAAPSGDGGTGATCFVNRECDANLRCECDDNADCTCQPGVRGTGKNGVDKCTSGNECASSLCIGGPLPTDQHYCSDECTSDDDCTGTLPRCSVIGVCAPPKP
ncbi:hypothetical protein AKJ09_07834 [Labilithrix luteola]|uniref:Uncharacterized protein n=2 Tax=Labilithrix luteola TaxID=1391654 RepID=A0A0K1Q5R5_9BACT|nr:hypothetical protein AKJ09_07834 [Labilithrix luteola]